ncbi:MAG: AAA family ATPase [Gammaproteobacteria bacterium]|nr:AAA family ATPase [Gammaproteobacteria bacterium]
MGFTDPLSPGSLRARCDPAALAFETTEELEDLEEVVGQARAVSALEFGVGMRRGGYNLYVLGPPGLGKQTVVREYLEREAKAASTPPDWCYVNNFDDATRPRVIELPAGRGAALRRDMEQLLEELLVALPAAFESDEYQARGREIEQELRERQQQAFNELQEEAEHENVALLHTPAGFTFAPTRDGEVIDPQSFEALPDEEKRQRESAIEALQKRLQGVLRQIPLWTKEARDKMKRLNRETADYAVAHPIDELKRRYDEFPKVQRYLDAVQHDVVENVDDFRKHQESGGSAGTTAHPRHDPRFRRYLVNVLVDHSENHGAPVIYEDNPLYDNLVGRVEHIAQMGALTTDFALIKPGALHRANGGYLLIDALKLLTQPFAWGALKRVLKAREIQIESLGRMYSLISTVSLEPEPIPLDLKVVLLGDRLLYYLLWDYDPEFGELFRVAVDFEERIDRDRDSTDLYARLLGTIVRRHGLRPLERDAVAAVIDHSARLVGDAEKLTTHMGQLSDLVQEADHWAGKAGRRAVALDDVRHAVEQRIYRRDRLRERIQEEIRRGNLLIDSTGANVGEVNGLSVLELGGLAFGRPSRITATVRLGSGEVIDIEREAELGGALHSKGVMILSRFLAARYVGDRPLSLSASLVFEQSYGGVEGDSASVAELCALLSALAEVPIRQSLAVTGSVNQHGQVQPIGGVNEKIEGFFDVCHARGLTGEQGVVIPDANRKHLMLREDVVEAAEQGRFHVYSVASVDQALALLTGVPAGERDARGEFPEGTVNRSVEARLQRFAELRQAFRAHRPEEGGP